MLDKLILVFYVDISNMSDEEGRGYFEMIKESAELKPEDQAHVISYFIPVLEGGTRIECLNPPSNCGCKNKTFEEKLEKVSDRLDRMDGIMFPLTRKVLIEKTER